ncbi:MAG: glycosyltransferase family 2 protein, partial [Candidatus Thorarchaeota archaeon]
YNRKDVLRKLLAFLCEDENVSEIIVVDDQSTDGTEEMVRKEFPTVRYVKGRGRGPKHAKQDGLQVATGEIVTFLDDDALPNDGWLKPIFSAFAHGEKVVQAKLVFENKGEINVLKERRCIGRIRWNMRQAGHWNWGTRERYIDLCHEFGVFVRRDVLEHIPFFDPFLIGDGYGESISFSLRLKRAGLRILFVPQSVIRHMGASKGGTVGRYNKDRSTPCGPFLEILVTNLIYLNMRFRLWTVPLSVLYYVLAGCYLSVMHRKNCLLFALRGIRNGLRIGRKARCEAGGIR